MHVFLPKLPIISILKRIAERLLISTDYWCHKPELAATTLKDFKEKWKSDFAPIRNHIYSFTVSRFFLFIN